MFFMVNNYYSDTRPSTEYGKGVCSFL